MRFFGWGPQVVADMTTSEMLRANDQAHRMAAADAKAAAKQAQRRR